ncbi:MAG: threonine synthase [Spirochaetaceae bacterium]|jgi:threonine synthase|nr:threonine synthase [Spirochaetaceae bacterium]
MKYYSTRGKSGAVSFAQAALTGLAPDGGLFVPQEIPAYSPAVISSFSRLGFFDLARETIKPFVKGEIPDAALGDIVEAAFNFPLPLISVGQQNRQDKHNGQNPQILELFHGPTAAFKDFGARFMARAFSYLRRGETRPLHILVATSGDTGGAVAEGFFEVEGIFVTVLYPKGRVSPLQERQIAGLGGNIRAIAVEGSFDDCQRLVKAALADTELKKRRDFSSANSINIARLVPQAVYYASCAARLPKAAVCVPSGNFGNLCAGLYAQAMGAPVSRFIAATNINKTFVEYIESGEYRPRESAATISNAMDVGAPSNFERISAHWPYDKLTANIAACYVDDDATRTAISQVYKTFGYVLDPHGAVGWEALRLLRQAGKLSGQPAVVLETAHPAKFAEVVEPLTCPLPLPDSLKNALGRKVASQVIRADAAELFDILRAD